MIVILYRLNIHINDFIIIIIMPNKLIDTLFLYFDFVKFIKL